MAYLLDSDIIISFFKNKKPGVPLVRQLISEDLFISVVSWTEIVYGIRKSSMPTKRMAEFEEFLKLGRVTVLSIDEKIGRQFIKLKIGLEKEGKRLADFDLLIAGTAIVHSLSLVTGNKKHFSRIKNLKLR